MSELVAVSYRKAWLKLMGLSDDEIRENIAYTPPTDRAEEAKQFAAMLEILSGDYATE